MFLCKCHTSILDLWWRHGEIVPVLNLCGRGQWYCHPFRGCHEQVTCPSARFRGHVWRQATGSSGRCCEGCPEERQDKTEGGGVGSGWGSKKMGEAGMGRLVSLYREERGKGRYERQGVRTLLDCVLHRVPQQKSVLRMGLNAEQNRRKNAKYLMQQEAGIRRREQFTLTWTCSTTLKSNSNWQQQQEEEV